MITLEDGNEWLVLVNSDEDNDYVTLLAPFDCTSGIQQPHYDKIWEEFTSQGVKFNWSYIKDFLEE